MAQDQTEPKTMTTDADQPAEKYACPPGGQQHIRRRRPYVKGTMKHKERRINAVADMLALKYRREDMFKAFRRMDEKMKQVTTPEHPDHYLWDLHWRSIDRYVALAREQLLIACKKTRIDALRESVAYWESVVRDGAATRQERGYAQAQLDRIYGVHAPAQVRMTTPPGQPIQVKQEEVARPLKGLSTDRLLEIVNMAMTTTK